MTDTRARGLAWIAALALLASCAGPGPRVEAEAGREAPPGTIDFVARNGLGTAHGTFGVWRLAEVEIDPAQPARSRVELEVEVASLDTGIGWRDHHLRGPDFFDVEAYPTARVRVRDATAAGRSERGHLLYHAKFDVRIRDVEKTIDADFELVESEPRVVEGSLVLNRADFGVGGPERRSNPFSVREEVTVHFRATLPWPGRDGAGAAASGR